MHCIIRETHPSHAAHIKCPIPGATKLPPELRDSLNASWLVCFKPGCFWLAQHGKLKGPLVDLRHHNVPLTVTWNEPQHLDAESTTPFEEPTLQRRTAQWSASYPEGAAVFDEPVLIGRSRHATIKLPDLSVSQIHALLVPTDRGLDFYDLTSRNGSYLGDGTRVQHTTLLNNSRIFIGAEPVSFHQSRLAPKAQPPLPSRLMSRARQVVTKVAATPAPVVITGESGVGKETIAQSLHAQSGLTGPLICANAACFTPQLARSELFGHCAGSFTGATGDKQGLFSAAHQGTLFLDEIADMSLSVQAELLRALETGMITPVGSSESIVAKPRIITATHKDLSQEVAAGRFRQDLFYRLFVVNVHIPPLRERPEDIEHLAKSFSEAFSPGAVLDKETIRWLRIQPWKGNIRELRNLFWKASVICSEAPTSLFNLRRLLENKTSQKPSRDEVLQVYHQLRGNIQKTADHLSIHRSTVHRHLKSSLSKPLTEAA